MFSDLSYFIDLSVALLNSSTVLCFVKQGAADLVTPFILGARLVDDVRKIVRRDHQ